MTDTRERLQKGFTIAELPTVISVLRRLHGHSLRDVAKLSGISAATLSRMERGKVADFNTTAKIAHFLGLEITLTERAKKVASAEGASAKLSRRGRSRTRK